MIDPVASHAALKGDRTRLAADVKGAKGAPAFVRLSIMMLLEFVVFGSWFATLGLVLATNKLPTIIGSAYSLTGVAAILSPLLLGAIGDRFLASEKLFAVAHLVGGCIMFALPHAVSSANGSLTLVLVFAYMLAFMPTLGLVNSIAFRHIGEDQQRFPYIRVFGPLGWVLAGLAVGAMGLSASPGVFTVAGVCSLALAIFSLTLPKTPPLGRDKKFSLGDLIGVKAFILFRDRNFTVLMICALLTSVSLGFYNSFASPYLGALGFKNVAGVLALGQLTEVVFIATIPTVLRWIGMKWALFAGMGMWGVRFALFVFAAGDHSWAAVVSVALHGICNDFFVVVAAMYIDKVAPPQLAAQAQSWLILVISGFGSLIGSYTSGAIFAADVAPVMASGPAAWTHLWITPVIAAVATVTIWTIFFRSNATTDSASNAATRS